MRIASVNAGLHRQLPFAALADIEGWRGGIGPGELRAQGIEALARVTTPIIKLPMKIRRQCGRCGDFNSVLVEPGQAVPAFKCSACGYATG